LNLPEAMSFINDVVVQWFGEDLEARKAGSAFTQDTMAFPFSPELNLAKIPMRCMRNFSMKITEDARVDFFEASLQALRFCVSARDSSALDEIKDADKNMNDKEKNKVKKLEDRGKKLLSLQLQDTVDLRQAVAVVKLQRYYRRSMMSRMVVTIGD